MFYFAINKNVVFKFISILVNNYILVFNRKSEFNFLLLEDRKLLELVLGKFNFY